MRISTLKVNVPHPSVVFGREVLGEYWSIRGGSGPYVGRWRIDAEVVVACIATARFGMDKIRCVAIDVEAHVTSVEPDDSIRLCGFVVQEHVCLLDDVGGG